MEVVGAEQLPDGPALIIANHCQMNGPIACELYFPGNRYTWCAGQMMHLKEVPAYAYQDFWSGKPKYTRWFYKLLSHIIAPLAVCIFNNAKTIGVYHDARGVSTFKDTTKKLVEGATVVVFPECGTPHNHIVNAFQDKFVDIAKLYYKRTGNPLAFVPMYIAPRRKAMYLGTATYFRPEVPIEQERERICDYLSNAITEIAVGLPTHTVIPYRNISRKNYPINTAQEASNKQCEHPL